MTKDNWLALKDLFATVKRIDTPGFTSQGRAALKSVIDEHSCVVCKGYVEHIPKKELERCTDCGEEAWRP